MSFLETIRRIEAERLTEAQAAIDAGWTPDDHPAKCCPKDAPQPKREGRSLEEVERLRASAQRKAEWWNEEFTRHQQALATFEAEQLRFDHGMLQVDLKVRQRSASRGDRLWKQQQQAQDRAQHFWNLQAKYTNQIEKRKS